MTAFAISKQPDRVLIASDTLGYTFSDQPMPLGFISKIVPFPHLRAALFGRGAIAILAGAAGRMMLNHKIHDFDSAVEELPAMLRAATDYYISEMGIEHSETLMMFEANLAGWSDTARRMRVVAFRNFEHDYEPITGDDYTLAAIPILPREYFSPDWARLQVDRQLIELMKAERRYFTDHPEIVPAIIGGEITITEVTQHGVNSRIVHRFEDYEQTRHAAAAVSARVIRGDIEVDIEAGMCRVEDAVGTPGSAPNRAARRRAEKLARRAGRARKERAA